MKKILLFVSLFTTLIIAQSFQIKQITNLNADCRNLTSNISESSIPYFVFEAHNTNSSSIYLGQYFPEADSFAILQNVTNDTFMNINPKLFHCNDSIFIIYQTNRKGNWDIAYQIYLKNQLSPVYYLADSSADETNPVITSLSELWFSHTNQSSVSYEKGNSIYVKDVRIPNSAETEVFHSNDSTKYSQASQGVYIQSILTIAARKVFKDKPFIVYKQNNSKGWGDEITLVNSGNCRNPKIHSFYWETDLSYIDDINGKSNIIMMEFLSQPIDTLKLFNYPLYNYDNFWALEPYILTKKQDFYYNIPYTYTASKNDSLFIRLNKLDVVHEQSDSLVYTKVVDNSLYQGSFGIFNSSNQVFYTIWEDSIDGHIQLFGKRYLYHLSGIKDDNSSPSSFTLNQNYPNPFNPTTTISYRLKEKGFVKLNIYNITGRLIKTLVNQTQNADSYETQFNAKGLSSGIYFYRLEIFGKGSSPVYSEIKKLVLLK